MERKGLHIVERNYHSRWGELDLVAVKPVPDDFEDETYFDGAYQKISNAVPVQRGSSVHFVEVKTRTGTEYGTPGAAVTCTKQQKLRKTALIWLQEQEQYYSDLCFDVIEVWVTDKTAKIRWLQRCF